MARIASFHLIRVAGLDRVRAMTAMATDRRHLAHTDGCTFWRLLGTGAGSATTPGADLGRWALFATWRDEADLNRFMAASPIAERWNRRATEQYHVRMAALGGHGAWSQVDVLGLVDRAVAEPQSPVAIVTRAVVRRPSWKTFAAATAPVDVELHQAAGLRAVVGIGEAPIGRQATFSVWSSLTAARAFAYQGPQHTAVVERTRTEQWYGEELFARFIPLSSSGTWNGIDPLTSPV